MKRAERGLSAPITAPDAQERAAAAANNPALARETVATAERRERLGWPWPVSGDDTTRMRPARVAPAVRLGVDRDRR